MTLWQKREIISLLIWGVVTVGFIYCSMLESGPSSLTDDSSQRNLAGAFIAAGIIAQAALDYTMRRREKSGKILVDERDEKIMRRSLEIVYPLLAVIIFLACIMLHDSYKESGLVPVGWLWFMAYVIFILIYLAKSIGFLVFYLWANKYGER